MNMASGICGAKPAKSKESFYVGKQLPEDARVALPSKDRIRVRYSVGEPCTGQTLIADGAAQIYAGEATLTATLDLGVRVSWVLADEKERASQAQFLIVANKAGVEETAEMAEKLYKKAHGIVDTPAPKVTEPVGKDKGNSKS